MLEYIKQHPILKHTKLIAYGQSLGGSVAISLVSRNEDKFDALIIENTFLSVVSSDVWEGHAVEGSHTVSPTALASATYIPSIKTFGLSGAPDMAILQDHQIRASCTYPIPVQPERWIGPTRAYGEIIQHITNKWSQSMEGFREWNTQWHLYAGKTTGMRGCHRTVWTNMALLFIERLLWVDCWICAG